MIKVHLIRYCYPSPSAISDMEMKCWTCFWVILGAQRATAYTPLNQWGLGFVVKLWALCESVCPEQRPCPRLGLASQLAAHFSDWEIREQVQKKHWPDLCFKPVWFKDITEQCESWRKDWASPSNGKQKNCPTYRCCCKFLICLLPSLIPMLLPQWMTKNPLFNQQWQSLTQIASGRLRGGLVRFTEATRIHEREEEDATGMFKPKHKPAGCHMKLTLGCWASSPLVQEVMVKKIIKTIMLVAAARGSTYGSAVSDEMAWGWHIFYLTLIHFLLRYDLFTGFKTAPSWWRWKMKGPRSPKSSSLWLSHSSMHQRYFENYL